MNLENCNSYIKVKWTEIYNRFMTKYVLTDIIGASILGELKFTKMTYFAIIYIQIALIILIYSVSCVLDDISLLLQSVALIGIFIPSAIAVYDLLFKNGRFVLLVAFILHVFKVNNNAKRAAILDDQIRISKGYLRKLFYLAAFAMSVYAAGAVYLISLKQLPAPYYIPFVNHTTDVGYVLTLIVQIGTVVLVALLHFPCLALFSLIILHYNNLVALIEDDFDEFSIIVSSSRSEKALRKAVLIKIVVQIIEARRYTEYINDLYKKTIFWQTAMAYLSTTVTIFLIIAFKWFIGTVGAIYFLLEIYTMSYLGQFMSNTNNKLANVVYFFDWNNCSVEEQKIILSLLHMTHFSCVELWVGIFAPLCVETGYMITENIYSYTMLLFNLIEY